MTLETAFLLCWVKHSSLMQWNHLYLCLLCPQATSPNGLGYENRVWKSKAGLHLPPDGATCLFPGLLFPRFYSTCCIGKVFWADWGGSLEEIFGRAGIFAQWPLTPGKQNKYSHPSAFMGDWFQDTIPYPQWSQNPWMFKSLICNGEAQLASSICGVCICGFGFLNSRNQGLKMQNWWLQSTGIGGWAPLQNWTWRADWTCRGPPVGLKETSHIGDLKNWGVQALSKGMAAVGFQRLLPCGMQVQYHWVFWLLKRCFKYRFYMKSEFKMLATNYI